MDNETRAMFNTIIEEMGRMEDRINKRMDDLFNGVNSHFDRLECSMR